jgi:hypothetical protein
MDQLPLLKVFKMGTPDAPWELKLTIRSASILALASRPKFLEVPHSRAPQQPVRDNRHHLRRIPAAKTHGPMESLPPEALELMSCDPLLGRCRKRRGSVQSPTRRRLQRADPKKAVCSWADISGRRPFRACFTRSRSLISALGDPRSSHSYLCVYLGNHSP